MAAIPSYDVGGFHTSESAFTAVAITPSDSTNFTFVVRGIYVGGAGNVVIVNQDLTTCTFTGVPAGTILPVKAVRVNSTSTTATAMVGLT